MPSRATTVRPAPRVVSMVAPFQSASTTGGLLGEPAGSQLETNRPGAVSRVPDSDERRTSGRSVTRLRLRPQMTIVSEAPPTALWLAVGQAAPMTPGPAATTASVIWNEYAVVASPGA